jgi:hypothetical protein
MQEFENLGEKYIMYLKLSKPTLHGLTSASSNQGTPQPKHYNLNSGHALTVHREQKMSAEVTFVLHNIAENERNVIATTQEHNNRRQYLIDSVAGMYTT